MFDFSGISDTSKYSCRQVGVRVEASWLHLKGLELKGTLQLNMLNHESWCVYVIGGGNDVFEQLDAHHNTGPGFFVQQGGNNTFLNCDSHENEDRLTSNGDGQSADGFGCHPNRTTDTGNVFRGAWRGGTATTGGTSSTPTPRAPSSTRGPGTTDTSPTR